MSFQLCYGLADGRLVPSRLAAVDEELYRVPAASIPGMAVRDPGEAGTEPDGNHGGTAQ